MLQCIMRRGKSNPSKNPAKVGRGESRMLQPTPPTAAVLARG